MKIAVLTAYTKNNPWTDNGKCDFLEAAYPNHMDYCLKHDYTYIAECYEDSEIKGIHPTWIKIFAIQKFIKHFDYVCWIDADAIFTNSDLTIEQFLEEDTNLVICQSNPDKRTNNMFTVINTGFMIFKNNSWSHNLLQSLIDNSGVFKTEYFQEQTVLDNHLKDNGYYEKSLTLNSMSSEPLKERYQYNNIIILPSAYHCYETSDKPKFIYHAAGDSANKKNKLIQYLQNA